MQDNGVTMIIRSHEPVMEGFEKMNNNIITIFSNTNYGGICGNNACILSISKMREITTKLIYAKDSNS